MPTPKTMIELEQMSPDALNALRQELESQLALQLAAQAEISCLLGTLENIQRVRMRRR